MPAPDLPNVAVIGAGTMGHAIALVHAIGGCQVRLQDVDATRLEQALVLMEAALDTLIESGNLAPEARAATIARIETFVRLEDALPGAGLIVESIVEDPAIKKSVFEAIDALADEGAIIASNTSNLDIFPLVPASRQSHAAIAHWYTPPYILDLVDIAPGPETDPAVIDALRDLYLGFGKRPVVFKTMLPGYIANRLQAALGLEIYHLLDEGLASAEDIDASIIHGLSLRMATLGYFRKADFTGLDMSRRVMATRSYTPPEPRAKSETLERLVASGRTGVLAGAGFYDYSGKSPEALFRERDLKLLKLKLALQTIERSQT